MSNTVWVELNKKLLIDCQESHIRKPNSNLDIVRTVRARAVTNLAIEVVAHYTDHEEERLMNVPVEDKVIEDFIEAEEDRLKALKECDEGAANQCVSFQNSLALPILQKAALDYRYSVDFDQLDQTDYLKD